MILDKSTVFGLEIAEPTGNVRLRFGLVRNFYQRIPVYTNTVVSTPIYNTSVDGDIGFTSQNVKENYSVGVTNK